MLFLLSGRLSLTEASPSRVRNKKVGCAGNSQHVAVNVFMMLYVLLFAKHSEQHPSTNFFVLKPFGSSCLLFSF